MNSKTPKPVVLIVLDGWGYNPSAEYNAIAAAKTPTWDYLWQHFPHRLIATSGEAVGLPDGQMGNSEVGHMNLGAGRVVYQDLTRINRAIRDHSFTENAALNAAIDSVNSQDKALHILGLLSNGGVHSHEDHIHAICELAASRGVTKIYVHAFLDGRDTPPKSALASIQALEKLFAKLHCGRIASIIGRYYAMDRDNRWDRVQEAYDLLMLGKAHYQAPSAEIALKNAYERRETDEFVKATVIGGHATPIADGDAVIFMNFRADRARQLSRALVKDDFSGFSRQFAPKLAKFVTLTEYADDLKAYCAFSTDSIKNCLADYLSEQGKTQLRLAETEKYAHVTFFFSCGKEALVKGEERILIPSPKVATYDLQPEMSASQVTDELVKAIRAQAFDFIICNYANADMVGHTGDFQAATLAVEAIDIALKRVVDALLEVGGACLITADHGNIEKMHNPDDDQPHTSHTTEPVPLLYVGSRQIELSSIATASLCDIAPTLLTMMHLPKPLEMTGVSLIRFKD